MRRCSRSQSSCFPRCPPGPDRCLDLCRRSGTLVPRIARRRRNPPLQVYAYEPQTLILRQNPCANPEANFLYLLIGSEKALLIDTGAVADAEKMPLARTVLALLPPEGRRPTSVARRAHASTP